MMAVTTPGTKGGGKDKAIPVQFFDELKGVSDETVKILNKKLEYTRSYCYQQILNMEAKHRENEIKLARYENLPIDRQFLARMSLAEIFQAVGTIT